MGARSLADTPTLRDPALPHPPVISHEIAKTAYRQKCWCGLPALVRKFQFAEARTERRFPRFGQDSQNPVSREPPSSPSREIAALTLAQILSIRPM